MTGRQAGSSERSSFVSILTKQSLQAQKDRQTEKHRPGRRETETGKPRNSEAKTDTMKRSDRKTGKERQNQAGRQTKERQLNRILLVMYYLFRLRVNILSSKQAMMRDIYTNTIIQ